VEVWLLLLLLLLLFFLKSKASWYDKFSVAIFF
jgi:hypothetical protein